MSFRADGSRFIRPFKDKAASYAAFKDLWKRKYGGFPTRAQAVKWTGNDNADTWLANVRKNY